MGDGPPLRALRKDGSEFHVEIVLDTRQGKAGLTETVAVIRDVTERERGVDEIRRNESRLRALTTTAFDILWEAHLTGSGIDGTVNLLRDASGELGFEPGEFPRSFTMKDWRELVHPDDLEAAVKAKQRAIDTGEDYYAEYRLQRKDGTYTWWEDQGTPVEWKDGKPVQWLGAARNITERKRAEEALRESEDRFRIMADTAPVMIWISGTDKLCTFFNKGWLDFTGRSLEQELGNGWAEGVYREDYDRCLEVYVNSFSARQEFTMEYRLRRYDGEYRWVLDTGVPRFVPDGTFLGYIGSAIDITERKRTEETLRKRTEQIVRHQAVLLELARMNNSNLLAAQQRITESDARTLGVERVSIWLFNEDRSEIVCQDLYRLSGNAHEKGLRLQARRYPKYFQALDENRVVATHDARSDPRTTEFTEGYLEPLGITSMMDVPIWLHGKVVGIVCHEHTGPIRVWKPEEQEFAASIADLVSLTLEAAERKRAEEALRDLTGRLIGAQEEERRRVARELHDDLTQRLAVLAIEAGRLEQQMEPSSARVREFLGTMKDRIVELSADIHGIARQLHPSILDDLGLVNAIEAECVNFSQREGIRVTFEPKNVPATLPRDLALCLYRMLQESLRNIAKHAKIDTAVVTLAGRGGGILLSVRDYGIGFDPTQANKKGGLGLVSMTERARLVRGELSVQSRPGQGTTVEIRVPLARGEA